MLRINSATKNLLFAFVVSEHHADSTRVRKKSRSLARAQDDTGAIFRIAKQFLAEDEEGGQLIAADSATARSRS
jgi:hypothetical protein